MRARSSILAALLIATIAAACTDVPVDDERKDRRLAPARGVIRGTIQYEGPRPCSADGHIVGSAVVLVFDRRNPPPPLGVATSAVNFVAVPGDTLFVNEPRSVDSGFHCPDESDVISASVPFAISPLDAGSYIIQAFYDRTGRFLPTFGFRNQPRAGDWGGGAVDLSTASAAARIDARPTYLPVDIGTPLPGGTAKIPNFTMGSNGFVADNVSVTIGRVVPFTRPYFHPEGAELTTSKEASDANPRGNPLAVPIVKMTQDAALLAFPTKPTAASITAYEAAFPAVNLLWGVPDAEVGVATADPFELQLSPLPPAGKGGLLVYAQGVSIPENAAVPALWPRVTFAKLVDVPIAPGQSPSFVIQGTPEETNLTGAPPKPMVLIEGITLLDDSLAKTAAGPVPVDPTTSALRSHVRVLVRPAALCLFPGRPDLGGVLTTPHFTGASADTTEQGQKPLFDPAALAAQPLVREVRQGCLPKGRYAMTLVYPTGQTWTVPNQMGSCGSDEGSEVRYVSPTSCSDKSRPVLLSQGSRGVLEIVGPDADGQGTCEEFPVPSECLHL